MSQKAIEVILARQLADNLAIPIFIVDPDGTLLFYNEPAERILGQRFNETGEMVVGLWSTVFKAADRSGNLLAPDTLPLIIALTERRPAHHNFWIHGLDGAVRHIEATAFPLVGQADRFLGAMAMFWEVGD